MLNINIAEFIFKTNLIIIINDAFSTKLTTDVTIITSLTNIVLH